MAQRDEHAKEITQVACLVAIILLVWIDAQPNTDVNQIVYWIIGGIALGVRDIRRLLGGSDDKG